MADGVLRLHVARVLAKKELERRGEKVSVMELRQVRNTVVATTLAMLLVMAVTLVSGCSAGGNASSAASSGSAANSSASASASSESSSSMASSSSGVASGTPALNLMGGDMQQLIANRGSNLPVAVIYSFYGEGGMTSYPLYGEEWVNDALDAVEAMSVAGETNEVAEDYSESYAFIGADGSLMGNVSFNMGNLEVGQRHYIVESDGGLSQLPFPRRGATASLDSAASNSDAGRFIEACMTQKPVSLTIEKNGASTTTASPDEIGNAYETIVYAEISYAGEIPGLPSDATALTFTMEDGSTYVLPFANGSYVCEYPEPIGAWEYFSESFAAL